MPISGTRSVDRVAENTAAADIQLSPTVLRRLEDALPRAGWSGGRHSFAVPATRTR